MHRPGLSSRCAGLMLAAGSARRYGSDKRKVCLADGTPLLVASMRAAQARMDEVWLVLRPEDDLETLGLAGYAHVMRCAEAGQGMGRSLACGVRALARCSHANTLMILLGDMPWIHSGTLSLLQEYADQNNIVVPVHRGQSGHPVIFGRRFWPELMALEGDNGARRVIRNNVQSLTRVEIDDPGVLLDVDTPEALVKGPVGR